MKYLVLICFLIFSNVLFGQKTWTKEVTSSELNDTAVNDYWILDTCSLHLSEGSYASRVHRIEKLYDFTKYFLNRPEYHLEILFLQNSNYDTISTHWGRIKSLQIKENMTYFNLDPLSFEIRDSIVTEFDNMMDDEILYRQVIFKVKPNTDYQNYLSKLELAYLHNDQEMIYDLFTENYPTSTNFRAKYETSNFDFPGLINLYYQKKYKRSQNSKLEVLPSSYPIEIGKIRKISDDDWYDEDENITLLFDDYIDIQAKSDMSFHYQYHFSNRNVFHLNPSFDLALKTFLGYELEYDESATTSLPSNIKPIGETKEKLAFLEKFIAPQVEVLERGMCNMHVFWNFNWVSTQPRAIYKIGLDKEEKKAYIFYNKNKQGYECTIYQYKDSKWIELETLTKSKLPKTIDHDYREKMMFVYFSLISFLTFIFLIRKRIELGQRT